MATAPSELADCIEASARIDAPRLEFLDACRGLAVLGMLLANSINVFVRHVPPILRHNQGDTLRAFDLPAPMFQFLIGVSLVLFLERRERRGLTPAQARLVAVRRFVLLVLLGVVLDAVGTLKPVPQWGVLQTLGLGGVVATAAADLPDAGVAAIATGLLAAFSGPLNGDVHHNPFAALAFVPLTLAGLLAGRGLRTARFAGFARRVLFVAAASAALAFAAYIAGVPFNKILGTPSFVAFAGAVAAGLLLACAAVEDARVPLPAWLGAVGANALTVWVLQYVLVYYPAWLLFPAWHRLPLGPGLLAALATLTLVSALSVHLGRRGIRIPL